MTFFNLFDESGMVIAQDLGCTIGRNWILDVNDVSLPSIGGIWETVNHGSKERCDLGFYGVLDGVVHLHLQKVKSGQEVLGDVVVSRVRSQFVVEGENFSNILQVTVNLVD